MECSICLLAWDSALRVPRLLPCGHTFCQPCLELLVQKPPVRCSLCQAESTVSSLEDVQGLMKNFALLAAEPAGPPVKRTSSSDVVPDERLIEEAKRVQQPQSPPPPPPILASPIQLCDQHGQLVHCWNPKNRELLCSQCLEQLSEMEQVQCLELPQVAEEVRHRIDAVRALLKLRRL